jgi:hypothetical protein
MKKLTTLFIFATATAAGTFLNDFGLQKSCPAVLM